MMSIIHGALLSAGWTVATSLIETTTTWGATVVYSLIVSCLTFRLFLI